MGTVLHHRGLDSLCGCLDHVWSWKCRTARVVWIVFFFFFFNFCLFILSGCVDVLMFWWGFFRLVGLGFFNPSSYSHWLSWSFISSYQVITFPCIFDIIAFKIKLKYMRLKYFSVFLCKLYWMIHQRSASFSDWVLIHSVSSPATAVSSQIFCNELKCRSM